MEGLKKMSDYDKFENLKNRKNDFLDFGKFEKHDRFEKKFSFGFSIFDPRPHPFFEN